MTFDKDWIYLTLLSTNSDIKIKITAKFRQNYNIKKNETLYVEEPKVT